MRTDRFFISARPSNESFLSQPGGVTLTPPPLFLPHRWDFPRAVAADTDRERRVERHVKTQQSRQNMRKTSDFLLKNISIGVLRVALFKKEPEETSGLNSGLSGFSSFPFVNVRLTGDYK